METPVDVNARRGGEARVALLGAKVDRGQSTVDKLIARAQSTASVDEVGVLAGGVASRTAAVSSAIALEARRIALVASMSSLMRTNRANGKAEIVQEDWSCGLARSAL